MVLFWKKYWIWVVAALLTFLFCFLRFYRLDQTFVFTGDPGRDMLALMDWKEMGKIPLLGPQTSAMPLNQSAFYFYILFPAFILTGGNPMSANITLGIFWIATFWGGLWLLRKRKDLVQVILFAFYIMSIYPLMVEQSRMVWNPSFVAPLLITGVLALFLLVEKYSLKKLWIYGLSLSLAVSLHFPVAVYATATVIYLGVFKRDLLLRAIAVLATGMMVFNLPTLAFEVRHSFLITKALIAGNWLGTKQFSLMENFNRFFEFAFTFGGEFIQPVKMITLIFLVLVVVRSRERKTLRYILYFVFLVGFGLMMASRMAIHSHYILGVVALAACFIATEDWKYRTAFGIIALIWVTPQFTNKYYTVAEQPLAVIENCFSQICERETEPMYVSLQSARNTAHTGYEYRYLLRKNGCQVRSIETQPETAKLMAVILENSDYTHGKTGYNELTLFGESSPLAEYRCSKDLKLVLLTK